MPDPNHHFGVCRRFVFFALPVNVDQDSDADEAKEDIRPAIANKRQRKPFIREQ
jgi:hypothetical protein